MERASGPDHGSDRPNRESTTQSLNDSHHSQGRMHYKKKRSSLRRPGEARAPDVGAVAVGVSVDERVERKEREGSQRYARASSSASLRSAQSFASIPDDNDDDDDDNDDIDGMDGRRQTRMEKSNSTGAVDFHARRRVDALGSHSDHLRTDKNFLVSQLGQVQDFAAAGGHPGYLRRASSMRASLSSATDERSAPRRLEPRRRISSKGPTFAVPGQPMPGAYEAGFRSGDDSSDSSDEDEYYFSFDGDSQDGMESRDGTRSQTTETGSRADSMSMDAMSMSADGTEAAEEAPSAPEAPGPGFKRNKQRIYLLLCVVFVVVVCGVVGALVAVLSGKKEPAVDPTPTPTPAPVTEESECTFKEGDLPAFSLQCMCYGNVTLVAPETMVRYDELKNDLIPLLYPSGNTGVEDGSCSTRNLALLGVAQDSVASDSSRDRFLLTVLFYLMNGESWLLKDQWLSSDSFCSWYGISCNTNANGSSSVQEIILFDNGLSGALSDELFMFPDLETLNISSNNLIGSIPSNINQSSNLVVLDLGDCPLETEMPSEIGLMSNLRHLKLGGDETQNRKQLQRTQLPSELWRLTNLEILDLDNAGMSGTVPTEIGLMVGAEKLLLSGGELTGILPTEIAVLSSLCRSQVFWVVYMYICEFALWWISSHWIGQRHCM